MREILSLFYAFAKIGLFTFGGGYAMLPIIQRELVEDKKWCTDEEVTNYFAVGQCTPGVVAVNTATFIGYKRKKTAGAVAATAGVVFPSLIIILIIAAFLTGFSDNVYVIHAFNGIRAAVCALVVNAVVKLWKTGVKNIFGVLIFGTVFVLSAFFGLSPVYFVIGSVLAGIIYYKAGGKVA